MKPWAELCVWCVLILQSAWVLGQDSRPSQTSAPAASQKPAAAEQPSASVSPSSEHKDAEHKDSEHKDAVEDLASALVRAASDDERNALLQQNKDLVNRNLVDALIRSGARLSGKGDYPKAISVFAMAQSLAEKVGDSEGSGHAYLDLGVTYRRQSDYPKALECFQKVVDIAQSSGNQRLLAQALTDRGIVLFHQGEYSAALDSYQQSLKLAEAAHQDQSVEHAQANIANVLRLEGNYEQAEQYNLKALAFEEHQGNDPREMARILNNLGNLRLVQSDYSRALHFYRRALSQLEKAGDPEVRASVLNNIGTALAVQGNYSEALDSHRRSLDLATQSGEKRTMCVSLAAIADVEQLEGNYKAAQEDAEKALALTDELGEKKVMAETLNTLGQISVDRGDYNAALATHRKSLSLAEGLGYEEIVAQASSNVSNDYYRLGKFDQAVEFAERSTIIAEKLGDRLVLSDARTSAGQAYRATGQLDQARRAFEQAIDYVEAVRSDLSASEETRQEFFDSKITPYQEMAEMLIAQHQGGDALVIAERAKGRTLLDILQDGKVQVTRSMTAPELEKEQQFESQMISLNNQLRQQMLEANPGQELVASLRSRLDQARRDYGQFQTLLYAAHPELKVKRGQPNPVTPPELTRLALEYHSALLEFLVCQTRTYLFVVTATHSRPDLEVYTIDIGREELISKSQAFREKLARRDLTFRPLARQLYKLLLQPARKQLAGENTLIVVPDGALWNLPFQALVAEDNRYLLERYAVSYVPSLTVLREMVNKRKENDKKEITSPSAGLLAMADPVLGKENLDRAAAQYRDEKLGPLPETLREVKVLGRIYGPAESVIYTGAEAREDRFKAEAAKFRVLHLATHGILDEASPMYSNVLLAPGGSGDDDGLLEAREIMQLDLKADLAVLSACETARGRISAGEGVIGLAWAFFVAGTSTTVVSQWKVESTSTAELMLAFHRVRQADQTGASPVRTARALQHAELKLLHDPRFADPVYWAGFIVVGDPQ